MYKGSRTFSCLHPFADLGEGIPCQAPAPMGGHAQVFPASHGAYGDLEFNRQFLWGEEIVGTGGSLCSQ